ncbi:Zinc finger BED domain-containing protein RICESLEEPER 2 [Linum perenne]
MRCVAHIINLVVQTSLKEIGMSVRRVREACKWVTASASRTNRFKVTAKSMLIKYIKELALDMPTRWNVAYIFLDHVEPYK